MRTDQIHVAIAQGNSRYEICHLTSKGVHILHKRGDRMEDSINRVLGMLRRAPSAPGLRQLLGSNIAADLA
jgi:hypothetical protein